VHYYILMRVKDEADQERVTNVLIGPPLTERTTVVDEQVGFSPPTWWKGDDFASRSGVAASVTLRRRV
jgi:hypothetical protein